VAEAEAENIHLKGRAIGNRPYPPKRTQQETKGDNRPHRNPLRSPGFGRGWQDSGLELNALARSGGTVTGAPTYGARRASGHRSTLFCAGPIPQRRVVGVLLASNLLRTNIRHAPSLIMKVACFAR
jgi:hypothetical protein